MPMTKNAALYRNWCQEWLQAMDVGGSSERLGWIIWTAWAGDCQSPACNKGWDLESHGIEREKRIQVLESPGMAKSPLKAWLRDRESGLEGE